MVLLHGYPDNAAVWQPMARRMAGQFRVLRYDVRGAGASGCPADVPGYHVDRLVEDFRAVLAAAGEHGRFVLVGHDWGSIQGWRLLDEPDLRTRVIGYVSISGPSMRFARSWFATSLRARGPARRSALRQLRHSWYLLAFQLPVLPELLWRSGLAERALGSADGVPRERGDAIAGLGLYRANLSAAGRGRRSGVVESHGAHNGTLRDRRSDVPVLVIAPRKDPFVSPDLQFQAPAPFVRGLRTELVDGGHWVIATDPELIGGIVADFAGALAGSPSDEPPTDEPPDAQPMIAAD